MIGEVRRRPKTNKLKKSWLMRTNKLIGYVMSKVERSRRVKTCQNRSRVKGGLKRLKGVS